MVSSICNGFKYYFPGLCSTNHCSYFCVKFQDLQFEISSEARSYYFPEENVTVVIPPNTLSHEHKPCVASITLENSEPEKDAKSKIYKFSPSDLTTQNRIMVVIPLFDSHSYDYSNLTLMYRKDKESEYMPADRVRDHQPSWLFYRNTCYIFLNHFSWFKISFRHRSHQHKLGVDSLLFYKCNCGISELKLTFGCFNETCECSFKHLIQVCYMPGQIVKWYMFC